jgi:hypothetical protein
MRLDDRHVLECQNDQTSGRHPAVVPMGLIETMGETWLLLPSASLRNADSISVRRTQTADLARVSQTLFLRDEVLERR